MLQVSRGRVPGRNLDKSGQEGDEQLDRPDNQTCMESCHVCAANFFRFFINTTAYHLGRYSLHLLLWLGSNKIMGGGGGGRYLWGSSWRKDEFCTLCIFHHFGWNSLHLLQLKSSMNKESGSNAHWPWCMIPWQARNFLQSFTATFGTKWCLRVCITFIRF